MKRIALFIAIAALFSATPAVAEEPFVARVAIAYDIGFLGDSSYNDAVHAAVQIAQKKYKLYEPFVREVPTTGTILDRTTRLRFLAKSGYTLIITVGSGYRDIVRRVSMEYPATQFALINDNSLSQLNISNIYFNESDEAFLAGAVAAASVKVTASKGTKVGVISASDEIAQAFVKGAKFTNSKVAAVAIPFNGDATELAKDLQSVDVIYSLWDKDSSVLQVAQTLNLKIIARAPDQYFASFKSLPSNVIAVIRKDLTKPIDELINYGLQDRALIEIVDEKRGIFGKEYNVKNKSITVTLVGSPSTTVKKKVASATYYLSK